MSINTRVLVMKAAPLRVMALITSNGYRDRDNEFITTKALALAVEESWKGGRFKSHPLLFWHEKPAIGDVVYAEMYGTFLLEIAKERADPFSKVMWDWIAATADLQGTSHGFEPDTVAPRGNGRTYHRIKRIETSVLPLDVAANPFTGIEVRL